MASFVLPSFPVTCLLLQVSRITAASRSLPACRYYSTTKIASPCCNYVFAPSSNLHSPHFFSLLAPPLRSPARRFCSASHLLNSQLFSAPAPSSASSTSSSFSSSSSVSSISDAGVSSLSSVNVNVDECMNEIQREMECLFGSSPSPSPSSSASQSDADANVNANVNAEVEAQSAIEDISLLIQSNSLPHPSPATQQVDAPTAINSSTTSNNDRKRTSTNTTVPISDSWCEEANEEFDSFFFIRPANTDTNIELDGPGTHNHGSKESLFSSTNSHLECNRQETSNLVSSSSIPSSSSSSLSLSSTVSISSSFSSSPSVSVVPDHWIEEANDEIQYYFDTTYQRPTSPAISSTSQQHKSTITPSSASLS